jgi:murein DD-endopeptidase MepM/ murein hydrolase activator NlpD
LLNYSILGLFREELYTCLLLDDIRGVANKKKGNNNKRFWRQRFRVVIQEESTFHERRAYFLSVRRLTVVALGFVLSVVVVSYLTIAHTPLTEHIVPGFVPNKYREDAAIARLDADSALKLLSVQEKYLNSLKSILRGDVLVDSVFVALINGSVDPVGGGYLPTASDEDLKLRERVEGEDRYALRRSGPDVTMAIGFGFQPVEGGLSDGFDLSHGHFGVDIEAAGGVLVHAVDDGAVLISDYTVEHGYVIVIQHRNNRISVYKHNASLLKEVGELVQVGDVIASVGNSGTQTTGPHLHFEWWVSGQPIDPTPWLRLGS